MAWVRIQNAPGASGVGGSAGSVTSQSTGAFGSANTTGNHIAVFAWGSGTNVVASNVTCSDNAQTPNTYTRLIFKAVVSSGRWCAIFVAPITSLPASGNLNPNVSCTVSNTMNVCAAEFSGGTVTTNGSASDGNDVSTSNIQPGNLTTTIANDLILAVGVGSNGDSFLAPANHTTVGTQSGGNNTVMGSGAYRIVSGTVTNNNPQFVASSAGPWRAAQIALQPAVLAGLAIPVIATTDYPVDESFP